jgi:hypothetical protein
MGFTTCLRMLPNEPLKKTSKFSKPLIMINLERLFIIYCTKLAHDNNWNNHMIMCLQS